MQRRETTLRLVAEEPAATLPPVLPGEAGPAVAAKEESATPAPDERRPTVLVVSRSASTVRWGSRWLRRWGFEVAVVADGAAAVEAAGSTAPAIVLAEGLHRVDGRSLPAAVREAAGDDGLPVVTLCSRASEAESALECGSTDVVRKPWSWNLIGRRLEHLSRLQLARRAVEQAGEARHLAERSASEAEKRLRRLGQVDHLTELPNRKRFEALIDRALTNSRHGCEVGVLYMDLDRFRAINEVVGREEGDRILRQVAERLQSCVQRSDLVLRSTPGIGTAALARLSGDEFTVLLTHVSSRHEVLQAARKVLEVLADPFQVAGRDLYLSATVGISLSGRRVESGEDLLQHAEVAMSEAKRQGGGVVRSYESSMEGFSQRKVDIHERLRKALEADELELYYQPLICAESERIVAAEALLRWRHPQHGIIRPAEFLPSAEGTDLMLAIGKWVLETACRQLAEWLASDLPRVRMAVNIASCQLRRSDLAALVEEVLSDTGVPPELLELELSEKGVLRQDRVVLQQLHQLKRLGVRLSVDDFGTGHSAIGYLKRFPLDVLKIDRSYVAGLASSSSDAGIASAMVTMAHSLDLTVVAEGVERARQKELLRAWRCDELQGFHFSPAVRAGEFRRALEGQAEMEAVPGIEAGDRQGAESFARDTTRGRVAGEGSARDGDTVERDDR